MGVVYLARAGSTWAAVKVPHEEYRNDRQFKDLFRTEIRLAGRINDPYVAAVVPVPGSADDLFLATEYVPGENLRDYVQRHGTLRDEAVTTLAAGLAQALVAMHGADVIHCDLKPSNVMLTRDGLKVIDFGIGYARDFRSSARARAWRGTPAFASPESFRLARPNPAMDVYSWAATIVFAATGMPPFPAADGPAADGRVAVGRGPVAGARLAGVPAAVRPLVERGLDPNPLRRPAAGELLAELLRLPEAQSSARSPASARGPAADRSPVGVGGRGTLATLFSRHWDLPGLKVHPVGTGWRPRVPGIPRRPGLSGLSRRLRPAVMMGLTAGALVVVALIVAVVVVRAEPPEPHAGGSSSGPPTPAGSLSSAPGLIGPTEWRIWFAYRPGSGGPPGDAETPAPGLTVTQPPIQLRGECVHQSATTNRPDALGCLDSTGQRHDPCWRPTSLDSSPNTVLCGYPGAPALVRFVLTKSLRPMESPPPSTDGTAAPPTPPISFLLTSGELCRRLPQPAVSAPDQPTYTCQRGGSAYGLPDRSHDLWTIMMGAAGRSATSPADITVAYY